ncbi:hypothetical protein KSS87_016195, partial [Heliosperma pusillum]
ISSFSTICSNPHPHTYFYHFLVYLSHLTPVTPSSPSLFFKLAHLISIFIISPLSYFFSTNGASFLHLRR